jgi:hypothetical protein
VFGTPADPASIGAYEDIGAERALVLLPDGDPEAAKRAMDDASLLLR